MGQTKADRHKIMYRKWKSEGYTDDEIIDFLPSGLKNRFKDDIQKTSFEAHFGVTWGIFITSFIVVLIIGLILNAILFL